jgi:hypothetical protein
VAELASRRSIYSYHSYIGFLVVVIGYNFQLFKPTYLKNVKTTIDDYRHKVDFEDTIGVIRICKSKDRQHNGQKN